MIDRNIDRQAAERIENLARDIITRSERRGDNKTSTPRALMAASRGRLKQDAPREAELWGAADGNPQKFEITWRDLTTAVAAAGGYLTGTETKPLTRPLVGADVVQAGANVITDVQENSLHPHVTTKPPFGWQSTEFQQLSNDTTMVIGQTAATIKRGGINARVSRLMLLQSDAEFILNLLFAQLANDALGLAALNGSGAAGQSTGVLNTAGVQSVAGTSMNISGLSSMEENCTAADASDARLTWFAPPAVRRLLRQRELTTGSGSIWPGRELLGHQAFTTSKMPSSTIVLGDFSNIDILLFGKGIEVLVNPFADFQSGRVEFQVSLQMDVVVHYPASFAKATSIT